MPTLTVNIKKKLAGLDLVINFKSSHGVTALFGPSGSGKTTLLNIMAGLEDADNGHIKVDSSFLFNKTNGVNLSPQRRGIGYVFQDSKLFPHMNVRANLKYGDVFKSTGDQKANFEQLVQLLDLGGLLNRSPRTLSGGERQRVAIGRAFLSAPRLVLMDEPLASLDVDMRAELIPYIEKLRDDFNIPIIFVSHNLNEVIRLADLIVILKNGKSVVHGTVNKIMSRFNFSHSVKNDETSAVFDTVLMGHEEKYGLSNLVVNEIKIAVPRVNLPIGSKIRIRILAHNVVLSKSYLVGSSILNVFKAQILEFSDYSGPYSDILLNIGIIIVARVTKKSVSHMKLELGEHIYAMFKATALNELGFTYS